MGEEASAETAVALPYSVFFKSRVVTASASSSSLGYLDPYRRPDSELESSLELHESDVVWSSSISSSSSSFSSSSPLDDSAAAFYDEDQDENNAADNSIGRFSSVDSVPSLPRASFSPNAHLRRIQLPEINGLSALLLEDRAPMVLQQPKAASPLAVPGRRAEGTAVIMGVGSAGGEFHGHHRHQSAPMNIPAWPQRKKGPKAEILEEVDREEEEEEEMVPPHMIVARSHITTTFSVFEGVGRTLKGRDLRRVRNAVLQKTGFLDL